MAAIITDKYRVFNVDSLIRSVEGATPENYLYTFIGNSAPWVDSQDTETINDTTPPEPIDCLNNENFIWRNMIALKRVLHSDISAGIKKRNWAYGTYYDIYRHDYGTSGVTGVTETGLLSTPTSLSLANYYVVTESGNVYICIDNNRGLNSSTDNPQNYGTGVGFGNIKTSDGYTWKYISTVSPTDYSKFSTLEFHPVKTILTAPTVGDPYESQYLAQEHAKTQGGAIFNILVSAGGSSSFVSSTITTGITIKGDGQGLTISANTNSSGVIQTVTVLTPGTGYTYCTITIDGVSGAVLKPIFTPALGLGADPVSDLNAYYALINTKLSYAEGEGDFTVSNDYRQIGIVANIKATNGDIANANTLDAAHKLKLDTVSTFTVDSEISVSNGTKARVIDWDPGTSILRVNLARPLDPANYSTYAGFSVGQTVSQVGGSGGTQNVEILEYTPPEITPYTGNIIYYENRRPIQRDAAQIEDLHITIEY